MNYYLDCEFHERFYKPLFGKKHHIIELISIGIVADDGREFYAISNEFDIDAAWNAYDLDHGSGDQRNHPPKKKYWLRDNVLKELFIELHDRWVFEPAYKGQSDMKFTISNLKMLIKKYGKSNKQIAEEIIFFINTEPVKAIGMSAAQFRGYTQPIFYGYYADYDWVLFCSLFGKMIDLPKGFPMYAIDLKQTVDVKSYDFTRSFREWDTFDTTTREGGLRLMKMHPNYPKNPKQHHALADAKWNKQLHEFLKTII